MTRMFISYGMAMLTLAAMSSGCETASRPYPTLKQTDIHVSWQMTRFRNAADFGRLTLGERQRGQAAYSAYKKAFDQAVEAAHGDRNAPTPEDLKAVASETIRVLSTIPY